MTDTATKTETAKPKTVAKAAAKPASKVTDVLNAPGIEKVREAGETAFEAVAASSKAALDGVIAFDKAFLGYTKVALDETVAHWRNSFRAKDVKSLWEMQSEFVRGRYETVGEQARSLVEIGRTGVENAVEPLRSLAPTKAA